jgi:cysteinyl-tRNA synthetase
LSAKKNHQGEPTVHLASELSEVVPRMKADLANDFNVPGALSHLFTAIRLINKEYLDENGKYLDKSFLGKEEIVLIENIIAFSKEALGCFHFFSEPDIRQFLTRLSSFRNHLKGGEGQHDQVEKLIKERKEARITKNWSRADEIRNALDALNVEVKDAPDGTTTWRFK